MSLLALQVGFLGHLSGRENIILSAMFMGMSKAEISSKLESVIDFSGLGEFIDQPVSIYSAGMRARLGFSVALNVDADVFLIDEVIAVGDAEFQKKAKTAIREKISQGKTAVIVSHNLNLIQRWCDRVIWLDSGNIIRSGRPSDVISAYQAQMAYRRRG
ncbi:MAG: ABC transporter ATP-binding protein [Methanobacteriota archaeon]|nr:MAG: ABC transporter ATP-binding protein [Euryarchaeota archaeon]